MINVEIQLTKELDQDLLEVRAQKTDFLGVGTLELNLVALVGTCFPSPDRKSRLNRAMLDN